MTGSRSSRLGTPFTRGSSLVVRPLPAGDEDEEVIPFSPQKQPADG